MTYGIKSHYNGLFHSEVEGSKADLILPENHRFLSVLWNGGWDEYIVDMATVRPLNDEENAEIAAWTKRGGGWFPDLKGWVLGHFAKELVGEGNVVKIVSRLASGD